MKNVLSSFSRQATMKSHKRENEEELNQDRVTGMIEAGIRNMFPKKKSKKKFRNVAEEKAF